MMDCDAIRPKLMAMLDGELMADERQNCEYHLGHCDECSQMVQAFQMIHALTPVPMNDVDVWPALQAQIAPDIQTQALLAEIRLMREEMQALSREVAELRHALKQAPPKTTALDLPYVRKSTHSPFQLV